ncbi:hypothetical protein [Bradyrhizobium sp. AS23.2]|uniref:hypothetical protein n=1 Tax=Bradyrhizobium sp. AS23.2 TaxID=1680155 RepID=UPI0014317C09|nr:hypothetical protein [Bradyrhizobium sp. AS23.2]
MSGSKEQATSMAMSPTMNSTKVAPTLKSSGDQPQMFFLKEYKSLSFMAIRSGLAYWPS